MVQLWEPQILIHEFDGEDVPFDAADLQQKLEQCFIEAGFPDLCYLAEEFALSVEYTLLSRRTDAAVGRGELNAAVVGALEETGFPQVAAVYRMTGGVREIELEPTPTAVRDLLTRFVACAPEDLALLEERVRQALALLKIKKCSPKLVVELARHYWWQYAAGQPHPAPEPPMTLPAADMIAYCTSAARELVTDGILELHGITPILPALRFELKLCALASTMKLVPPVLDLELAPELYRISAILASCRQELLRHLSASTAELPLFLDFSDMSDFVTAYMGGERLHFRRVGRDIVKMTTGAFDPDAPLQIKMK